MSMQGVCWKRLLLRLLLGQLRLCPTGNFEVILNISQNHLPRFGAKKLCYSYLFDHQLLFAIIEESSKDPNSLSPSLQGMKRKVPGQELPGVKHYLHVQGWEGT